MTKPWEMYQKNESQLAKPWEQFQQQSTPETQQAPVLQAPKSMSYGEQVLQNLKDEGAGLVRGAGSIGATLLTPLDWAARKAGIQNDFIGRTDRRAAMDAGLKELGANPDSGFYAGGKLAGEIAGTAGAGGLAANAARTVLPAAMATKAAPLLSAIQSSGMTAGGLQGGKALATRALGGGLTGGMAAGLVDPENAQTGALFGAGLPLAFRGIGGLSDKFKQAIGGGNDLAKKAINDYGIPLGVADTSQNAIVKATRSVLNDVPVIGGVGDRQREALQQAFNKAVGSKFGAEAPKLTPEVIDSAKKRMGAEFDRIWNNNVLKVDDKLVKSLIDMEQKAAKLPQGEAASLRSEIQDIYSKMADDGAGNVIIDGQTANKFQSYLRRRAEGSSGLKNELGDLRQNIIQAFNRGVSPEDAAALTMNRSQYKVYKTVEPLLNKGEVGVAGREAGDIPAALLPSAVAQNYTNAAGTPLADLSKIGSKFLVDRVSRAGGSPRAMIQNSAIGASLGMGAYANPATLAVAPAAYGLNQLLGNPALAKTLINMRGGLLTPSEELMRMGYQVAPVLGSSR